MTLTWSPLVRPRRPTIVQVAEYPRSPLMTGGLAGGLPGVGRSAVGAELVPALRPGMADFYDSLSASGSDARAEILRGSGERRVRDREVAELTRLLADAGDAARVVALFGVRGVAEPRGDMLPCRRAKVVYHWFAPRRLVADPQREDERIRCPIPATEDFFGPVELPTAEHNHYFMEPAKLVLGPDLPLDWLHAKALAELRAWLGAAPSAFGEAG